MSEQAVNESTTNILDNIENYHLMPFDVMVMILNVPDDKLVTLSEDIDIEEKTKILFREIMNKIAGFKYTLNPDYLVEAIAIFISMNSPEHYDSIYDAYEDVVFAFSTDAKNNGEHNWEQGIPISKQINRLIQDLISYCKMNLDSGNLRNRILFDLMVIVWTVINFTDMIDMPRYITEDLNATTEANISEDNSISKDAKVE